MAGPVHDAQVQAFRIFDGSIDVIPIAGASATADSSGSFSMPLGGHTGPFAVIVKGGWYRDEATNAVVQLDTAGVDNSPQILRALHPGGAGTISITVSPLTELATALIPRTDISSLTISRMNTEVSEMFGGSLFHAVNTQPVDITDTAQVGAAQNRREYGLLLATLSQNAVDEAQRRQAPFTLGDMLLLLQTDAADGVLSSSTRNNLSAALSGFSDSDANQSSLDRGNSLLQRNLEYVDTNNTQPIADAGANQEGAPQTPVQLDGSNSYDPDGPLSSYQWIFSRMPAGSSSTLNQADRARASFIPDVDGLYILTLTVSDANLDPNSDSVRIVISGNQAPVASAVGITVDHGGLAKIGDSLSGTYTYTDDDSDVEGASTYRWLRGGSAISGATLSNYTVQIADNGATLTFEVTPVAVSGNNGGVAVSSNILIETDLAPTATSVAENDANGGSLLVGDLINGTYTYNDAGGDLEGVSTYRWLRNGSAISGATGSSYTLVAADSGNAIRFEVTPVAATGVPTGSPVQSSELTVANSVPLASNLTLTDVNGASPEVGDSLTGGYTYLDADLDAQGVSTFRWLRDGAPIAGATSLTYTLVGMDGGSAIRFEVTPIAATGSNPGLAAESSGLVVTIPFGVDGAARFLDIDANGIADSGDQIVIPFTANVTLNSGTVAAFKLAVTGDSFGTGASVASGPASNELTITLGTSPLLRTRHDFSLSALTAGAASGIDISASMPANMIEDASGGDAVATAALDIYPGFVADGQSLGSGASNWTASADIDGDGDLDLIVANGGSTANRVYTNNGSGVFTDSGQMLGSDSSYPVVIGDLDADGDLDLIFGNWLAGNRVYLNNGSGIFSDSGQALGNNSTMGIALGDVDGDTDLDLVVANSAQPNQVYFNDGSGVFTDSGQSIRFDNTRSIALGDIDGDGDLDMISADAGTAGLHVLTNNGSGTFTDSGQTLASGTSIDTWDLVIADLDGDNDLDLAVALSSNNGNLVFFNNGSGVFTDSLQSLGSSSSYNMEATDFDQDGDLDLVIANNGNPNRVYLNDGAGTFLDSRLSLASNRSRGVTVGDFDNDGDLDLSFSNELNQGNKIYAGSLSGTRGTSAFVDSGQSLGSSATYGIEFGDLDGDGDLDLATGNWIVGNRVYMNNGSGTFTDSGQALGSSATLGLHIGDIDGDGDLDIVAANSTLGARVYTNNGAGVFTDTGQALSYANERDLFLADFDADGDLDLVTADASNGGPHIWTNNGAGVFTDSGQVLMLAVDTWGVAVGDIDGDHDLDLVFANSSGVGNKIFINNGSGVFANSGQSLAANSSYGVDLGDIDHDGDLDLVFANNGEANRVYLNNGSGVFTDSGQALGANRSRDAVFGDVDGDGDLDIYVTNDVNQADKIYLNNGNGVFTDSGQSLGSNKGNAAALGDVDGDGDLDVAVAHGSSEGNKVYFND